MHDVKSLCFLARPSKYSVGSIGCSAISVPQRSLRRAQIDRAKNVGGDLCASDAPCTPENW